MKVPLYTVTAAAVRTRRAGNRLELFEVRRQSRRDPPPMRRRPRPSGEKVQVYRLALKRVRSIRVPIAEVSNAVAAVRIGHALLHDSPVEQMLGILVNSQNKVVGTVIVATTGQISGLSVSVRALFMAAIAHNASAVIAVHNHPSGVPRPSEEDERFTASVVEASRTIGIPVLDHVIVTPDREKWYSFQAMGRL